MLFDIIGFDFDVDVSSVDCSLDILGVLVVGCASRVRVLLNGLYLESLGAATDVYVDVGVEPSVLKVSLLLNDSRLRGDVQSLEASVGIDSRGEDGGCSLVPQHRVNEALEFRSQGSFRVEKVKVDQILSTDDLLAY